MRKNEALVRSTAPRRGRCTTKTRHRPALVWSSTLAIVLLTQVVLVEDAHAYLDPGTGSILFQAVVAAIAGAAMALRMSWGWIRGVFSRRRPQTVPESHGTDERQG